MPQLESKPTRRLKFLRELYETVLNNTESFEEGAIGADLAYLMGAVLHGSLCEWTHDRPLVRLLREHCLKRHRVWNYICIEQSESDQTNRQVRRDSPLLQQEFQTSDATVASGQRNTNCCCGNCNWEGDASQLRQPIADLSERLGPNPQVLLPEGECPRCGALAYLANDMAAENEKDRRLDCFNELVGALEIVVTRLERQSAQATAELRARDLVPGLRAMLDKAKIA